MIYAYRGVELVVGVMGVLAAGGAFSVVGGFWISSFGEFGLVLSLMGLLGCLFTVLLNLNSWV